MVMLRVFIGPDGLARTRFALTQLNVGATLLYHLGRRPDTVAPYWRARAAEALDSGRLDLLAAITMRAHTAAAPDFIAPNPSVYEAGLDAELHDVATAPTVRVAYEMSQVLGGRCLYTEGRPLPPSSLVLDALERGEREFAEAIAGQMHYLWVTVFAQDWSRIRAGLEADIAYRSTRIARDGYGEMIDTIDPRVSWRDGALCVTRYNDNDVTADALIFTPTPFGSHTLFCLDPPDAPLSRLPFLSYPSMSAAGARPATAESSRPAALFRGIQAYIDQSLANPELSPAVIAAAQHISERYLYLLFAGQGVTVAGWIRDRRLQRCRQDLADPALRDSPVAAIGTRWGFASPAQFSRVFRKTFGVAPGQYRLLALRETSAGETPAGETSAGKTPVQATSTGLQPALMTAGADACRSDRSFSPAVTTGRLAVR
jgi:AraC-like DNA-binding protein